MPFRIFFSCNSTLFAIYACFSLFQFESLTTPLFAALFGPRTFGPSDVEPAAFRNACPYVPIALKTATTKATILTFSKVRPEELVIVETLRLCANQGFALSITAPMPIGRSPNPRRT